jgi:hypothetical protein
MSDLRHLLILRQAAKVMEDAAIAERRRLDEQIANAMRVTGKTSVSNVFGEHKVTITYGTTRKVDDIALKASWDSLPTSVLDCFRVQMTVDAAALKALPAKEFAMAAKYITEKPAAPAVRLQRVTAA